jgi:hypothetical protein
MIPHPFLSAFISKLLSSWEDHLVPHLELALRRRYGTALSRLHVCTSYRALGLNSKTSNSSMVQRRSKLRLASHFIQDSPPATQQGYLGALCSGLSKFPILV